MKAVALRNSSKDSAVTDEMTEESARTEPPGTALLSAGLTQTLRQVTDFNYERTAVEKPRPSPHTTHWVSLHSHLLCLFWYSGQTSDESFNQYHMAISEFPSIHLHSHIKS